MTKVGAFFNRRLAPARQSHLRSRMGNQPVRQFVLPTLVGLFVQPGDLRQAAHATVTEAVGFQHHVPPPPLLIQAAQEQVHLLMQLLVWVLGGLLAIGTTTSVHPEVGIDESARQGRKLARLYGQFT